MKKATLKTLGLDYWIGEDSSPDGLPVFTPKEVEILKNSRDSITPQLLRQIYDTKQIFPGISLEEASIRIQEEANMNQDPREEIGYQRAHKPSPKELAAAYGDKIKSMLKGSGAKTRQEKEEEQPELFR